MLTKAPEARNPDRPNVLLIITDQQHWRMMSCAGNEHLHTPAMDSLAANGVRFDRTYCANPTCVPSRMAMFMGLMPSQMNMIANPSDHCTVTDEMRRNSLGWLMQYAGYDVAYAGKVHLSLANTPASLGFANYLTWDHRDGCAGASADFIRQQREKPFFLVTSLINPHDICLMGMRDYLAMPGYPVNEKIQGFVSRGDVSLGEVDRALQRPNGMSEAEFRESVCPPLPENFEPDPEEPEAITRYLDDDVCGRALREQWSEQRWREYRHVYARLTERVDGQIAQVLQALHDSGQEETTLVVFVSDHGDSDAARKMVGKNVPYEESMRVPFILSRKGMGRAGEVDHTLVSSGLDLIPTLCDYAGIDSPVTCRGRSVRPLAEGRDAEWRDHVVVQAQIARTIFRGPWQYITFCSGRNQQQLFHLDSDPHAMRNLIHVPEHQDVVHTLREALRQECLAIGDELGLDMLSRCSEWKGLPLHRQTTPATQA